MAGTDPYGLASDDGFHVPEPVDIPSSQRRTPGAPIQRPGAGLRPSMVGADHPAAARQRAEDERLRQCRHQFGSDGEFRGDMRFNPDRAEKLREVGKGLGTGIKTTASLLPGGGFATAVNEASEGNFGEAALSFIPGVAALKVLRVGSKTAKGAEAGREATGFLGRAGYELRNAPYQKVRNKATQINGRDYSGHALDQMQNRGLMPSVVENVLSTGTQYPTRAGTTGYYDAVNNIRVIVDSETGRVVTVIRGAP
jgi:hypothetical protein